MCSWPGPAWICLALLATVEEKRRLLGDRVALRDLQCEMIVSIQSTAAVMGG